MVCQLSIDECKSVGGAWADYKEYYPPIPYDLEIVGWSVQIVAFDVETYIEKTGVWSTVEHINTSPVYDIQPIYGPREVLILY